jgi:hypothetical protein
VDPGIADAVVRYSLRPGAPDRAHEIEPTDIVVVPPPDVMCQRARSELPIQRGLALARRLLAEGRRVRLIAEGATLESLRPGWTPYEAGLLLTELGAYRASDSKRWSQPLRRAIEDWLETVFSGALPEGLSAANVFYSVACSRLFQPLFEVARFLDGIVERHPTARFHCADPDWVGLPALRSRAAAARGGTLPPPHPPDLGWPVALRSLVAASVVRTSLGQLRAYHRSRAARRWLADRRRAHAAKGGQPPEVWLAVVPCWGERANRHVLDTVATPSFERGLRVGLLVTTSLEGGPDGRPEGEAADMWPVLREVLPPAREVVVEQAVLPESLTALTSALSRARRAAMVAAGRIAARDPVLDLSGLPLDLRAQRSGLAKLLGTDLIVALTTGRATEDALARHRGSAPVVFSALGFVESAGPSAWCQRAHLPTVDFVHGTGNDTWHGAAETRATCRAVWSRGDAETVNSLDQRAIITGVPRTGVPKPPRTGPPQRVLVLSNYVHESWAGSGYPLRFHQAELLRAVQLVRARFGPRFQYRWRPHPSDNETDIAVGLRQSPGVVRSTEPTLSADLAWSDLVISSNSSSSIEALLWGRPVFLHTSPLHRFLPEARAFAEERRFFRAAELPEPFAACVGLMDAGDPAALAPEVRAREALHGPDGFDAGRVLDALLALGPC